MTASKKPRADSKLKNLAESDQETIWRLLHPSDSTVQAATLEAVQIFIASDLGFSVALSTLSEWHSWYALKLRMESAAARANQTAIELAKNSDLTPEDIERVAQTVFTAETLQQGNVKSYVALAKLGLARRSLDLDSRRVSLLESKAAQADRASAVANDSALSEEEKAARLKQIFRM